MSERQGWAHGSEGTVHCDGEGMAEKAIWKREQSMDLFTSLWIRQHTSISPYIHLVGTSTVLLPWDPFET